MSKLQVERAKGATGAFLLRDAVRSSTIAELLAVVFDLWDLKSYFSGFLSYICSN